MTLKSSAAAFLAGAVLAAGPAMAGKDLFVIDLASEPTSLDPHVQWNPDSYYVYRNVFDNLVTRNDAGAVVPEIATSWQKLSDSEIEFTLRSDAVFHDGKPVTPDDVAFSVKRITNPAFKSPQLGQFNKITDAVVTGPNKVKLVTDGPYPALMAQLVKLSVVPRHAVTAMGDTQFNQTPLGSGPYKFTGWQRGVKVTLEANAGYWGAKGPFPQVEFRAVPDAATRVANLRAGRSDLIVTINPDHAAELKGDPRVKVLSVVTERVAYLRLNTLAGPTANLKVRQAIAHAIDKAGIVDSLLGGYDKPANIMATEAHFGYVPGFKGHAFDPARARQLVAEAGDAAKGELVLITAPVFDQRIVQALQQMIADVGLNVQISLSDMQSYLRRSQGPAEQAGSLAFGRWSCACQDLDGVVLPLFQTGSIWSKFSDPAMDKALIEARSTLDDAKRLAAYRRVHEIVEAQVPAVPLYEAAVLYAARREVGWQPTANESLFLNRMSWKD